MRPFFISKTFRFASALFLGVSTTMASSSMPFNVTNVYFQDAVTGVVTGVNGPIAGVTVSIKGSNVGATSTDDQGQFSIKAAKGQVLSFTAVGYESHEQLVDGNVLNISLTESGEQLDEVVVVAFGTQKKVNMTGSVATITPKQLAERPVTSMQNALQGISPGITVLSRPGDVGKGSNATISVRGRSNFGSPSPMFIIDGIPATSTEFSAISPQDIASMSVLKDAASSSLYGSRAANGVILVTTKKGGGDKAVIGVAASYGWQRSNYLPKMANSLEYIELMNRAKKNYGAQPLFTDDVIQKFKDGSEPDMYPNTDWYKELLKQGAPQRDLSFNVTSPGKLGNYYLGMNYFDQESLVPGRKQDRLNIKLNTQSEIIKDLLTFNTNISFLKQDYDRDGGAISWVEMGRALPTTVARHTDGTWGSISNGQVSGTVAKENQLRRLHEGGRSTNRDNYLQMAGNASLTPFEGFSLDGMVSLKYTNTNSWAFDYTMDPVLNFLTKEPITGTANTVNEMKETWGKREELLTQITANYERRFGDHWGKITAGASQESNVYRDAFLGRKNFLNNDQTTIGTGSSAEQDVSKDKYNDKDRLANSTIQEEWSIRSFFGRFNYSYKDKYLFEANTRIDYSSRFAEENRRAVFPSFSAGWNIDKESFMDNVTWLDALKLRGSWGSLGNQDVVAIGNYYELISLASMYSFEGVAVDGAEQAAAVNRAALWEKVYMSNVGIDATVLGGKVNITADYFVKNTRGILMQRDHLATGGWNKYAFENQGETTNKGIELMVTYNGRIGDDFRYSLSGNISKINNTINTLGSLYSEMPTGDYWINRVGGSVGDYYLYKSDGLFTSQEEIDNHPSQVDIAGKPKVGDIKYVDVNGDGVLNAEDRTVVGNDVPWFNYGFNISAAYKGFDIDVLTYGVGGVKTYMGGESSLPFYNNGNVKSVWLNGWTEENNRADADFPRITQPSDEPQNYINSDFWLFSGNFFRIRAITVGYTFEKAKISKLGMSNFRIYASSNNPFTIHGDKRMKDYDPEMGSGRPGYPGVKTFSLGLTAKF